jgi:hypothetical protein
MTEVDKLIKKTANQESELCNISEGMIIFTVELVTEPA